MAEAARGELLNDMVDKSSAEGVLGAASRLTLESHFFGDAGSAHFGAIVSPDRFSIDLQIGVAVAMPACSGECVPF